MKVLLDTHILLWALADSPKLSRRARDILEDPDNDCCVSSASVWEIAIKVSLGKHKLGFPLQRFESAIEASGFSSLAVTIRHALALGHVKTGHADPFDRLLLAQCEVETLRLLTTDKLLVQMPVAIAC